MKKLVLASILLFLAAGTHQVVASVRFTPPPGDTSLRDVVHDLGSNAEERQQLLDAITVAKTELFERPNAAKGWKNNVAGAYTFFISSTSHVWTGQAPDAAAQDGLFSRLGEAMAADLAGVSDRDKAVLYNTMIASASLPLLLYVDGQQSGNREQMEQARTLAGEYSRALLQSEPQALVAMLSGGAVDAPSAARAAAPAPAHSAPKAAVSGGLDGQWECMVLSPRLVPGMGGNSMMIFQPVPGVRFEIAGNRYRTTGGGGTVSRSGDTLRFSGTDMNGMVASVNGDSLKFGEDQTCSRP
ncbi:DUF6683 family protein [Arenimonas sp.]|uniref:DUF6683 family protein n=1 Tax=Arenimonas sp. TaxID=1872635 RepID=UPI002E380312|nr:DUF6683 family protein [Arenimonas sp.]HEX4854917.1 DUF6683 family protein [Arenimonas sp.]